MTAKGKTRAIILAAGTGSRLMPLTADRPKCMVELIGKTLLARQLEVLRANEINDIAIVTGHAASAVPQNEGLKVYTNPDYAVSNMVVSLFTASDWLQSGDDIVVSYGDIVYTSHVLEALLQSKSDISVCVDKDWQKYWQKRMDDPLQDAETMKFGEDGRIIELGKKPQSYADIKGQYIGLQLWRAPAIEEIVNFYDGLDKNLIYDGRIFPQMFMTSFLQNMIDADFKIMPVLIENGWLEVDTLGDMNLYERLHERGELKDLYDAV